MAQMMRLATANKIAIMIPNLLSESENRSKIVVNGVPDYRKFVVIMLQIIREFRIRFDFVQQNGHDLFEKIELLRVH